MVEKRAHIGANPRKSERQGCRGLDNPEESLRCVFSTISVIKIGSGTTARKQRNKLLWHVEQQGADEFGVRKINPQFVPVGESVVIDRDTLLADYTPEVEIHNTRVEPAMIELRKTIAKGEKYRKQGKSLSAEMEYSKALDVDEVNVRAIFGLGLVYLDRGDKEKSCVVFEQLVDMDMAFDLKHKHLFNEFGINLRKNQLYDEAVEYYGKAVELTSDDENLYYNLARAFYEKDDWNNCFEFLSRALDINIDMSHALDMCRFMVALSRDEKLCVKYGKPVVPDNVARQALDVLNDSDGVDMTVELEPGKIVPPGEFEKSTVTFDDVER